ncbi:thioredoxin domain-containing protein-like [Dreissena polymorpha]|uniref:thioredoxin domain-containing protein-like n=1 Tax=Dreissena polymorpha TaxID=45954 RepID=UPI0022651DE9|nr:thioredoxin domain-containing protein-like [Dreissena polymorpha]
MKSPTKRLTNATVLVCEQKLVIERFLSVLFKSSRDCPTCDVALENLEKTPQPELLHTEIVKKVVSDEEVAAAFGVTEYPAIVFYRKAYPALYHGELQSEDDVAEFVDWLTKAVSVATIELFEDSFEHLTQASSGATTGDWMVLFYTPQSEECIQILPAFENAAIRVKHWMNFAKVNIETNKKLAERFKITKCPTAKLFKQGKMYHYEPQKYDSHSLVSFVDGWFRNVKSVPVPREPSSFDLLTESIALYIKEQMASDNKLAFVAIVTGGVALLVALLALVLRKSKVERPKQE